MAQSSRPQLPATEEIARLPPDGGPNFNRLIFEQSPYLLQHATNPVDWRPWGEEAFEEARRRNVPVFLSIGYATCHWCHVMEHESFEDEQVARLMNENFVNIKVDREERPDIDGVYMTVTQALTGHGGWPMTVLLTPDKKPFFAGTYFPKGGGYGRPGMMDLVPQIAQAWRQRRGDIDKSAEEITNALANMAPVAGEEDLTWNVLSQGYQELEHRFDPTHGGFGDRPKFPVPHNLLFLLRHHHMTGEAKAHEMVERTLEKMRLGGLFDQIGYGFHRYSTDEVWLLPHFEKMLYDNALLAMTYLEAYQVTGKAFYAEVAREVFAYVQRDMTDPGGGFYSAEDADSEGVEGKFYLWTPEEVLDALGAEEGAWVNSLLQIRPGGNFREEATGHQTGESIPHLREVLTAEDRARLELARERLFAVRERRVHPLKDDKVLTDWNGLMIAAFAKGAMILQEPEYADAAREAADFALTVLKTHEGRLLKRWRQGKAGLPGHLEDYAFMVWGLIELYEATFETRWLQEAVALTEKMVEHFVDREHGGFFATADDGEKLLVRQKDAYDGAIPSGNAVAALNLLRLARMTGRTEWESQAGRVLRAFSENVTRMASAHSFMLMALQFVLAEGREAVLAGAEGDAELQAMAELARTTFLPFTVLLHRPPEHDPGLGHILRLAPALRAQIPQGGRATGYVCQGFACQQPVTELDDFRAQLLPKA